MRPPSRRGAGHWVEVLRRIYHHSVGGQDEILIARMDAHRRRSLWGPGGTHGGRNTAPGGIGGQRMALADITMIRVVAGERRFCPGHGKRPQQDSNLRTRLRRPMLYPLSYGGCATQERLPAAGPLRTLRHG